MSGTNGTLHRRVPIDAPPAMRIEYTPFGPRHVALGYRAAEVVRKSGRPMPQGGSGDYHSRWDLKTLRAESQRFDRDNGLYTGTVNRLLDNILGDGFRFQARTANARTNKRLEALWADWCMAPEVREMDDWCTIERMAARHLIVDGDVAAIKTDQGRCQLIEAERIAFPGMARGQNRVESGVEIDAVGKPVAFHIADYDPSGFVSPKSQPYSADSVVYVAWRARISQTRGIPVMVPSFPMFHRINDVCDSEAIAWQLLSRLAVAITRKDAAQLALDTSSEDADAGDEAMARRYHDIGEAVIFHGDIGEEIKGIERNIPGADFPKSIETFMRLLGLPIGFPLELMLLDWSQTNYSSARAAMLQAYRMLTRWQKLLMRGFHSPLYTWKVRQWIEAGEVRESSDVFRHEWFPPPFPWIDPLKDAEADALLIDRGHATYAEVLKGQNRDREEMIETRAQEIAEAIAAAKAIEAQTGEKVPWQLFCGMNATPQAAATQVTVGGESGPADADLDFKRKAWLGFQADGTVSDIAANLTDLKTLTRDVGLPVNDEYTEPYTPVIADNGQPVSGEVVRDSAGDIVGGDTEEPDPQPAQPMPEKQPDQDEDPDGGAGEVEVGTEGTQAVPPDDGEDSR